MKFKFKFRPHLNITLLGFFRKEIRQTLRDYRMRVVLFVAPIVQLTLFGVALSNEVRNVQIAAIYSPSDSITRQIYERSVASGWFIAAATTGTDLFQWIRSGEADVVLVAPAQGLRKDILRNKGEIQVLINSQNVIKARAIESYLQAISAEVLAATTNRGSASFPQITFETRTLYNPSLESSTYMVPGVMSMLVCMLTVLMTSMGVARERESGTFETLLAAPIHNWEIILGKTVPYMFLGLCQIPLILAIAVLLFSVPVRGPLIYILISSFFFIATTVSIGLMISTIAQNQQQAMLGGFLFLFPAILLSGAMFPIENMPLPMWCLAQINPLTHYIGLLRNVLLKGGNIKYFIVHSSALILLSISCVIIAFRRFRQIVA